MCDFMVMFLRRKEIKIGDCFEFNLSKDIMLIIDRHGQNNTGRKA